MCRHIFSYPDDRIENYNSDKKTLTGVCKICGAKQKSYGMRWVIPKVEEFYHDIPYWESIFEGLQDNAKFL